MIMKSKVIIAAVSAATLLAGAAVFAVKSSTSSLFRANVEALADATPVQTCYLIGQGSIYAWHVYCNKDTSPEMIYSCETEMTYHSPSGTSLCTK